MRISGDRCKPERRGGGTAIARPVEGNEPDAAIDRELLAKAKVQPGTRGPVEVHHHGAVGFTRVKDPQHPTATTYLSLAHLLTIAMHAMTTAANIQCVGIPPCGGRAGAEARPCPCPAAHWSPGSPASGKGDLT